MRNSEIIKARVRPYSRLAICTTIFGIMLIALFLFITITLKLNYLAYIFIIASACGTLVSLIVPIVSFYDRTHKKIGSVEFHIVDIKMCCYNRKMYHTDIHILYPKELDVEQYKIIVIDNNGKKKKLNSVMSYKTYQAYSELFLWSYKLGKVKITYLQHSKILLNVEMIESGSKNYTKRENSEIEKLIHKINTQL